MSSTHTVVAALLWICLGTVVYAYAGYPLVIWCLSRLFGRRHRAPSPADADLPVVSVLIAAHNEEAVLDQRLRNALEMDYPAGKLEIVVASDGCTDGTADVIRRYAKHGVRLLDLPQRRGKAVALNTAMPTLRGEIVLFSDANTFTEPSAGRKLVRWFADTNVGAVCGRLVLTDPASGRNADSLYWRYETFLKRCEGRLGALLGANGGIYALRRAWYVPLPDGTILDDMLIPLLVKLQTGCDLVYDAAAVAHEETPPDVRAEFHRRSRIGNGGFSSLSLLRGLLSPRRGWVAFTFLSHKVLRWVCPFFLLGLLVCNFLLWQYPLYAMLLAAQVGFCALSFVAAFLPGNPRVFKVLRLATMFTGMNGALLVGFFRWLFRADRNGQWKRTVRLAEAQRRPSGVRPRPACPAGQVAR
jgi:cellulose synthase/poly-beta-1,6-N-acetylglucosamine synthase-like glycosyltransferase